MKAILFLLIGVGVFAGVMAVSLAMSGNLSKEGLDRILGKGPKRTVEAPRDDLDPIALALREREEALDRREEELRLQEDRVRTAQQDLEETRRSMEQLLLDISATLDSGQKEQAAQQAELAVLLEKMKPEQVAKMLEAKDTQEALDLYRLIPEKVRPRVFEKLTPDKAAALLDALRGVGSAGIAVQPN